MTESRTHFRNHYVPIWYQERFLSGKHHFKLLDLNPEEIVSNGHKYTRRNILNWSPKKCFVQDDLYTTAWGNFTNEDIEKFFFGEIEDIGMASVPFIENYDIKNGMHEAVTGILDYLSVQKIRTPRGLRALERQTGIQERNALLIAMQSLRRLNSAIFCDSTWQIASAERSPTKFIVSDNPVTIYNMGIFPRNRQFDRIVEPDIRRVGSQIIFPLSSEKVLILTNLSWVRNPFQNPLRFQPNPKLLRNTIFNGTDVQIGRLLSEVEVCQINYIIKVMAERYVAAPERDWLFPESKLSSTHWSRFGKEFLLHPDPRCVSMGGSVYVGYKDGTSEAWNEFGHRPWEKEFENKNRDAKDGAGLRKIQSIFKDRYGARYRGCAVDWIHIRDRDMFEP